jgi:hypothetical protein
LPVDFEVMARCNIYALWAMRKTKSRVTLLRRRLLFLGSIGRRPVAFGGPLNAEGIRDEPSRTARGPRALPGSVQSVPSA